MIKVLSRLLPVAVCALLAACPSVVREAPEPQLSLPPIAPADVSGATVYQVSSADSETHVMVFRGGTLARLGHNHVMTSKAVSGRVWLHPQIEKSGFELAFPVAQLIVDDPDARRAAGSDFPPDIPQSDKEATRRNMLRAEVLDGERFPTITLRSARIAGSLPETRLTVRITIKEVSRDIEVPARIEIDADRLSAAGEFEMLQTDFGIRPFSIGLGALEVQNRLRVKFNIVASEAPTSL